MLKRRTVFDIANTFLKEFSFTQDKKDINPEEEKRRGDSLRKATEVFDQEFHKDHKNREDLSISKHFQEFLRVGAGYDQRLAEVLIKMGISEEALDKDDMEDIWGKIASLATTREIYKLRLDTEPELHEQTAKNYLLCLVVRKEDGSIDLNSLTDNCLFSANAFRKACRSDSEVNYYFRFRPLDEFFKELVRKQGAELYGSETAERIQNKKEN